jgi:hypothetical protein
VNLPESCGQPGLVVAPSPGPIEGAVVTVPDSSGRLGCVDEQAETVKVRFVLEPDEHGYPPFETEDLWAAPIGDGTYRIDNAPFFVLDIAVGDIVRAAPDRHGVLWAGDRLISSGNCTIRIIPSEGRGPSRGHQYVLDVFTMLGAGGEGFGSQMNIVVVSVPPDAPLAEIKRVLLRGVTDGIWEYEEGCITGAWISA